MVGTQMTMLRQCSNNRLFELNLYIDVKTNTHPDFDGEVETSFTLDNEEVYEYKLPKVVDADGNDEPVVYIDVMDAQEDKYPPFLGFENDTNTIILRPNSTFVEGRTFYFTIVVKEKNSDTVLYPYYCTVKINGNITDMDEFNRIDYIDINYTINYIDEFSKGSMKFTEKVNMTWMSENFFDMFKFFWRDTTYRTNKLNRTL